MSDETKLDISKIEFPQVMDLRTAAIFLELSSMRVRTLARDGGIPSAKDEAGHWTFNKADLEVFKATPRVRKSGGGGPRGEGKLWQIRIKHTDLEQVRAQLNQFSIELEPRYNYEKQRAYREERAAKQKAAAKPKKQ